MRIFFTGRDKSAEPVELDLEVGTYVICRYKPEGPRFRRKSHNLTQR